MNLNSHLRIIVLGYLIRGPLGGLAWHYLNYLLGLSALGHDVYYIEDSEDEPAYWDPIGSYGLTDPSLGLRFASHALDRIGFGDRWAFYDALSHKWIGPRASDALDLCETADLVLNVCGLNLTAS